MIESSQRSARVKLLPEGEAEVVWEVTKGDALTLDTGGFESVDRFKTRGVIEVIAVRDNISAVLVVMETNGREWWVDHWKVQDGKSLE